MMKKLRITFDCKTYIEGKDDIIEIAEILMKTYWNTNYDLISVAIIHEDGEEK